MNEEVIIKFGLTESNVTIGRSFFYGIQIYHYRDNIYFACCEINGGPTKENYLNIFKANVGYFKCSKEALIFIDKKTIDEVINRQFAKYDTLMPL